MGCQPEQGLFVCLSGRQLLAEHVLEGGAHVPRFQQAVSCGAGSCERAWVPFWYRPRFQTRHSPCSAPASAFSLFPLYCIESSWVWVPMLIFLSASVRIGSRNKKKKAGLPPAFIRSVCSSPTAPVVLNATALQSSCPGDYLAVIMGSTTLYYVLP